MSAFLRQAQLLLSEVETESEQIYQAKKELNSLTKISGLSDLIHDPKFQNVINLLTPFIINYKVNQVIKLLKELGKEYSIDPTTGFRRYI